MHNKYSITSKSVKVLATKVVKVSKHIKHTSKYCIIYYYYYCNISINVVAGWSGANYNTLGL